MNWWHYLILANLYLAMFYGFYLLLLRKETYFMLNRVYLVSAAILSFFIPMIQSEWVQNLFITQKVQRTIYYIDPGFIYQVSAQADNGFTMAQFFTTVYWAVAMLLLARLFYRFVKLKRLIQSEETGQAFSFFGNIKVDENLPEKEIIRQHEQLHVRHLHSADVLLFEALTILNWFNPVIYLYRKSIKHNHEFMADQNAISFGVDKSDYAMLLLSQQMGVQPNLLVNSFFNQSLLKQRIMMLHKNPSKKSALLKYGLSAPLFGLMLVFTSATVSREKTILKITEQINSDEPLREVAVNLTPELNVVSDISAKVNSPVTAGQKLRGKVVDPNGEPLSGVSVDYAKKHIGFITDKEGNFTIPNYEEGDLINFSLKKGFGDVKRGFSNVTGKLSIVVLHAVTEVILIPPAAKADSVPVSFARVEKLPSFPGGEAAFGNYLAKSIRYPKEARDQKITGRVIVTFVVETDGKLTGIKVLRDIGGGCGAEAIRVLSECPDWNPGLQNGKPVRVAYTMPVNFTLASDAIKNNSLQGKVNFMNEDSVVKRAKAARLDNIDNMTMSGFGGKDSARQRPPADAVRIQTKVMGIDPVYFVDGKEVDKVMLQVINRNDIESISVLNGKSATVKYGDKGKDGVVEITTKKAKKP